LARGIRADDPRSANVDPVDSWRIASPVEDAGLQEPPIA